MDELTDLQSSARAVDNSMTRLGAIVGTMAGTASGVAQDLATHALDVSSPTRELLQTEAKVLATMSHDLVLVAQVLTGLSVARS